MRRRQDIDTVENIDGNCNDVNDNKHEHMNKLKQTVYNSSLIMNDSVNNNTNDDVSAEIKEKNKNKNDERKEENVQTKISFDIKNVLTYAYLPVCLEKMKEGEYMYKWNNSSIFQKKSLKFFYLDVNNYCIRWYSKKKKLKENKNPLLYIHDIIQILDGWESPFFKKKEAEKNLSIEIISNNRNLRVTFLDIQRWKMWLFGLMYYHYKLGSKENGRKMKLAFYENNKIYDSYIVSGLKDINALTLSQFYTILRSLNIYLNMKIIYHYFSIYKNKGTINYSGFTKILEHIFSNAHISYYFNTYKDKKNNYMDKKKLIEFLIEVQFEGKSEENILTYEEIQSSTKIGLWEIPALNNTYVNSNNDNGKNELNNIVKGKCENHDSICEKGVTNEKRDRIITSTNNDRNEQNAPDEMFQTILQILKEKKGKEDKNTKNDKMYLVRAKTIYKILNFIKKYNSPFVIINESQQLTEIGFIYFLLSKENSIMNPEYSKVYQNMNLPLCNYWINSSHNSYLGRKQIFSTSNIEQYIYILIDGCRCVEFDCYYFNKNIVVYHGFYGYKLTSSILFCDALIACKIFGFIFSPYPIILSLEIHCKNKHKNLIAKLLISILGNQLYIPKTRDEISGITPNNCKNKFLVKYKHFNNIRNDDGSSLYQMFEGLQSIIYEELDYLSDIVDNTGKKNEDGDEEEEKEKKFEEYYYGDNEEEEEEEQQQQQQQCQEKMYWGNQQVNEKYFSGEEEEEEEEEKKKEEENSNSDKKLCRKYLNTKKNGTDYMEKFFKCNKGFYNETEKMSPIKEKNKGKTFTTTEINSTNNNNLLYEYSCLKGYVFRDFNENRRTDEICSISENKFIKLIKKNEREVIKYNQKTLTRVYPSGTRLSSTNFNPLIFWNAGIQVVALNYQYNGLSMLLNKGRFLENGGKYSGYILKPNLLRSNNTTNDFASFVIDLQILSLHQINFLFSIKNKYQEKKLKKELLKMDMIKKIQTHKKIKKGKGTKELQKMEREKRNILFSDIQSDDNNNKKKNVPRESILLKKMDDDVYQINDKFYNVEQKYEDMLSEYKSYLLCSSLSHSSSFNSTTSSNTSSNSIGLMDMNEANNDDHTNDQEKEKENEKEKDKGHATNSKTLIKNVVSKKKNKNFYQAFEELKKANNIFFYLYLTISVHGYNEKKYYFKTEIAKVNFYDLNYCWQKPSSFEMKIRYPSLALIVFELKSYDTVKSEVIACASFPVKCLREGIRFVPLCDKYLKEIKGSGILVNLKMQQNGQ